jgi:hypothetical protein
MPASPGPASPGPIGVDPGPIAVITELKQRIS